MLFTEAFVALTSDQPSIVDSIPTDDHLNSHSPPIYLRSHAISPKYDPRLRIPNIPNIVIYAHDCYVSHSVRI